MAVVADQRALTGPQDISSFVDFTALAESAETCSLALLGYTTQAHFLIGCGSSKKRFKSLQTADPQRYLKHIQEAKQLHLAPGDGGAVQR